MQWLAIVTWVVVLMLVLPAGGSLLPSLGLLVMVTGAGLGTMVVFAITGNDVWAWISFGSACMGVLLAAVGSRSLVYDSGQLLEGVPDLVKGTAAMCIGVGLPFLIAAVPICLGTAITVS